MGDRNSPKGINHCKPPLNHPSTNHAPCAASSASNPFGSLTFPAVYSSDKDGNFFATDGVGFCFLNLAAFVNGMMMWWSCQVDSAMKHKITSNHVPVYHCFHRVACFWGTKWDKSKYLNQTNNSFLVCGLLLAKASTSKEPQDVLCAVGMNGFPCLC